MQIVAGTAALLAPGANIYAHMGFIGSLVLREAQVPVNAVGAVFHPESPDTGIDGAKARYHLRSQYGNGIPGLQVFSLMGIEPLLVVVLCEFFQKRDNLLHIYRCASQLYALTS